MQWVPWNEMGRLLPLGFHSLEADSGRERLRYAFLRSNGEPRSVIICWIMTCAFSFLVLQFLFCNDCVGLFSTFRHTHTHTHKHTHAQTHAHTHTHAHTRTHTHTHFPDAPWSLAKYFLALQSSGRGLYFYVFQYLYCTPLPTAAVSKDRHMLCGEWFFSACLQAVFFL